MSALELQVGFAVGFFVCASWTYHQIAAGAICGNGPAEGVIPPRLGADAHRLAHDGATSPRRSPHYAPVAAARQ